jgi:hypothetical protein
MVLHAIQASSESHEKERREIGPEPHKDGVFMDEPARDGYQTHVTSTRGAPLSWLFGQSLSMAAASVKSFWPGGNTGRY